MQLHAKRHHARIAAEHSQRESRVEQSTWQLTRRGNNGESSVNNEVCKVIDGSQSFQVWDAGLLK